MRRAALASLACLATACGGPAGPSTPAATGVRAYLDAVRRDDPRAAYALLSEDTRRELRYDDFALQWKQQAAERAWQATALAESLQGNPDVGERAVFRYPDGKLVYVERDGAAWRLESELVSRSHARRPRDAIQRFAEAVRERDVAAVLASLTRRRREGLAKQVEGFIEGLGERVHDKIDEFDADRAELRWDENGIRYRIVLRREEEEWRVDDIYIRPAPEEDEGATGDEEEGDD